MLPDRRKGKAHLIKAPPLLVKVILLLIVAIDVIDTMESKVLEKIIKKRIIKILKTPPSSRTKTSPFETVGWVSIAVKSVPDGIGPTNDIY